MNFDGLHNSTATLPFLSRSKTRSISSENRTGEKSGGARCEVPLDEMGELEGPSRELGVGWKVKPKDVVKAGETFVLADIEGPGAIQQIWMTVTGIHRFSILRVYYDGSDVPSVEVPVGDFFAAAYCPSYGFAQVNSQMVCVNPGSAFNCYWTMPFRRKIRMTLENIDPSHKEIVVYYQINYALNPLSDDVGYLHAQFRRTNPVKYGDVYTILDGIEGEGHYVGTYMAWSLNNNNWWGEGEIKFYLDGDTDPELSDGQEIAGSTGYPTICGTGTEDYFGGSYNFEDQEKREYVEFSTPYVGVPQICRPDGLYRANTRFSMYRWHVTDPIRFEKDLKVTMQALGWRSGGRFLPLQDDISSVAFWYQKGVSKSFPSLPDVNSLEII
jgi:hypothetical protein